MLAIVWLVLMAAVFYLLLWRPQQRRMSAARGLQGQLKVNDEVVTTSGIFGRIVELNDSDCLLEICPGTVVRMARGAIGERLTTDPSTDPSDSEAE